MPEQQSIHGSSRGFDTLERAKAEARVALHPTSTHNIVVIFIMIPILVKIGMSARSSSTVGQNDW
jgi:hypothetical protein